MWLLLLISQSEAILLKGTFHMAYGSILSQAFDWFALKLLFWAGSRWRNCLGSFEELLQMDNQGQTSLWNNHLYLLNNRKELAVSHSQVTKWVCFFNNRSTLKKINFYGLVLLFTSSNVLKICLIPSFELLMLKACRIFPFRNPSKIIHV